MVLTCGDSTIETRGSDIDEWSDDDDMLKETSGVFGRAAFSDDQRFRTCDFFTSRTTGVGEEKESGQSNGRRGRAALEAGVKEK
jgi:hypothetical protein